MNTEKRKYFGTDGIRGSVGEEPVTPDFIMRLGWAAGKVLAKAGSGPILVGKDTRVSGYMFESALEAGLSAAGVNVLLLGPMPTPAIAFLVKNTKAQAGIVISASHNPFYDNGIKFFSSDGMKLSHALEAEIESKLDLPIKSVHSLYLGKAKRLIDAPRRYIEFCKSKLSSEVDLRGLHILIDCANGAAYHVGPQVFEELGAKVTSHAVEPDGVNINAQCGATAPEKLCSLLKKVKADVGIALDGDGDRLIMADNRGDIVDGDEILFIIAEMCRHKLNGGIVGTVMSNLGLERAIHALQLDFIRAAVGDRHITALLQKEKLVLGGETSGHIINLSLSTTGDGIIAALQVLEAMLRSGKSLRELKMGVSKIPQVMRDIRLPKRCDISTLTDVSNAVKETESILGRLGRVVLRSSGTEPLVRIMVEGEDKGQVVMLADQLTRRVNETISNISL